jgi:hypothetical protein
MFAVGAVKNRVRRVRAHHQRKQLLAPGDVAEINVSDWPRSVQEPTAFYEQCFRYFTYRVPNDVRDHRGYFERESRAYGESAFHAMWFLLFREFRVERFLEIGVYRGQTLSLASLLQRHFRTAGRVAGISPFTPAGDSVSRYRSDVDYYEDTLINVRHFDLPTPELVRAYSTDPEAIAAIRGTIWDCVYIDGNHDYDVVRSDWEACAPQVRPGGIIVLDDAGLTTRFRPPAFATKGHPGPSRLAAEVGRPPWAEILQVGHNRVFQRQA